MAYKTPNWAQTQLQNAAGLGDLELSVAMEDEARVVFQGLFTRDRYVVQKRDGKVSYDKNESAVKRSDHKRERSVVCNEGFL